MFINNDTITISSFQSNIQKHPLSSLLLVNLELRANSDRRYCNTDLKASRDNVHRTPSVDESLSMGQRLRRS